MADCHAYARQLSAKIRSLVSVVVGIRRILAYVKGITEILGIPRQQFFEIQGGRLAGKVVCMTTTAAKQPSRRRQPAANPALSREEIARVALEMGSTEGFEQLSMRSLARVLGVTPMALYHHVKDKKDLNALIVDSVLTQVQVPGADFGDWIQRLAELTRQHYAERTRYPGFDVLLYETRITPQGTRLMEGYIQVLLDGGFSQREAVLGLSVLYTQGFGASLLDRQLAGGAQRTGKDLPKTNSVSVASHWRQLSDSENGEFFRAIRHDILVAGLESIRGTMPDEE